MSNTNTQGSHVRIKLMPAVSQQLAQANLLTPITVAKGAPSSEQLNAMLASGGGNLSIAQAAACLRRLPEVMKELLNLGHQVAIPGFGTFRLRGKGVYNQDGQPVAGKELNFKLQFLPNPDFKTFLNGLQAEIIPGARRMPLPEALTDLETNALNGSVVSGSTVKITGNNLHFNPLRSDEGVYFIAQTEGEKAEVCAVKFLDNRETRLTLRVPELQSGMSYRVEVRKRFSGCKALTVGMLPCSVTCD